MKRALLFLAIISLSMWAGARELRLMTFNVRHCTGLRGDLNLPRTAAAIEKYAPDFVALQELDSCADRSLGIDQLRLLGEGVLMRPTYAAAIPIKGGKYGVGLLSKEKPLSVKRIPMPSADEDRVLLVCEFGDVVVACTHLSLLESERPAMVDTIIHEAARWHKPFILMGDLNANPHSPEIRKLSAAFRLLNNTKSPSFPADNPTDTIDYIALYRAPSVGAGGTGARTKAISADKIVRRGAWTIEDSVSSDHRPLLTDITLPTPAARLMTYPPYLQDPRPDRMTVYFQTDKVCHTWIEYGEDSTRTRRARTLLDGQEVCYRKDNRILLDSLTPATRYYYRVCAVELTYKRSYETHFGDTVRTRFYSFRTPSDKDTDFTALLFNDLHQVKATYDSLRSLVQGVDYDFVLFNGDCLPEPEDYADAVRMIHRCADPVNAAEKPVFFLRGNHEIRNFYSAGMHQLIGYRDDLTYGAMNWGDTRFVFLDLGEDKPDSTRVYAGLNDFTRLRRDQTAFLQGELNSKAFRRAARRILVSHIPVFGNTDTYRPCTRMWGSLLKDRPFDLYYCAHTHELRYFPNGVDGCRFPVLNGGGPALNESAVSILRKKGASLHLRTLTPKGVFLDTEL